MNLVIKDHKYASIKGPMYHELYLIYNINQYFSQEIASKGLDKVYHTQ